jgi:ATP-dependent HslUV protease ATP-binding subunit HslU
LSENSGSVSPKDLVSYLDNFIVGQVEAKKSLAIAIIDRARRMRIADENVRKAIIPSNILLLGPTGSGKTEVARRLAKKVDAPFVKVVATKYSEVGFVGDDTASMIEELAENSLQEEVTRLKAEVNSEAEAVALEEVTSAFLSTKLAIRENFDRDTARAMVQSGAVGHVEVEVEATLLDYAVSKMSLNEKEAVPNGTAYVQDFDDMGSRTIFGPRGSTRSAITHRGMTRPLWRAVSVSHALKAITERSSVLLSRTKEPELKERAKKAVEERGIIFIDEFDKMISEAGEESSSFNQKRRGVEKELLTLIEGTVVQTKKLGPISTDHIVFICAGAFSCVSPKQIMPELQGRLPIRCELKALTEEDFVRILESVENALPHVQRELMLVDGVEMRFTACGIRAIARSAVEMNTHFVNTGARRLNTVMGLVLEEIKFNADELVGQNIEINSDYVNGKVSHALKDSRPEDLRRFIL